VDEHFKPPLQLLHSDSALIQLKLDQLSHVSTEALLQSLLPGQPHALKVRPDGTILDGNHRIKILRTRGVDIDQLPREIIVRK
jgi:hypothetical protein